MKGGEVYEEESHDGSSPPPMIIGEDYLLDMNLKGGEVYEEEPHDGSSLPPNLIHDHDLTFPHDMSTAIQSGKSARKYEKQCIVFLYIIIKLQNVM